MVDVCDDSIFVAMCDNLALRPNTLQQPKKIKLPELNYFLNLVVTQIRMSTTVLVVHLFVCLMKITVVSIEACRSVRSVSDFALFRHTYRQISGTRFESCAATCDADPLCYSFNYFAPTMTCELNNSSRRADSGNFLRRSGSVYLDKLKEPADYCVSFPCRNNGTCKAVRRHPGFECFCHDEFTGAKCESKKIRLMYPCKCEPNYRCPLI